MSASILGRAFWTSSRDRDGHRTYVLTHKVVTTTPADGPAVVMTTAGLPVIGSSYSFGNDFDDWAFCTPEMSVTPLESDEEDQTLWRVDQVFTTVPTRRCQDESIEDPLLEPPEISGSFVKYTKQSRFDRNHVVMKNSCHEPLDFDKDFNRPGVTISKNVLTLPLEDMAQYTDHLNSTAMWGLQPRQVKLSNIRWSRKLYGVCTFYYNVSYDFDVSFDGFDVDEPDYGTKVLLGTWGWYKGPDNLWPAPVDWDLSDAAFYTIAKDKTGEPMGLIPLDGSGRLARPSPTGTSGDPLVATLHFELYNEADLLTIFGLPASL